jgi:lipoprotein-releasing system permease protein
MPYEVFLAFRYLRSRNKRKLARVTSIAAVLGVCMGVAALIVAMALANGFRDEMREKILQGTAHLTALRADGQPLENPAELANQLGQIEGVVSASVTTYDAALAQGPKDSSYAVIRGIENGSGPAAQAQRWLIEGSVAPIFEPSQTPNVIVGSEFASRIGVSVGDVFQIIPASRSSTSNRFRVAGIFRSGLFEYDSSWIYVAFKDGDQAASVMSVQVRDIDNVKQVAAGVTKTLGSAYTIVDWQQANQPLFAALALERRMGLFILGLIIAIGTLNITTMLILVVAERRRDIAILNALGAKRLGVMLLFVIEGAVVGAVGAITGVLLGIAACFIGNYYKLVSLPADVYSISNVPLINNPAEMFFAALIAFLLSVLATIYPAWTASHMRPVEALRDS